MASAKERFYANQLKKGAITSDQFTASTGLTSGGGGNVKDIINGGQATDAAAKASSPTDNTPAIRTSMANYDSIVGDITGSNPENLKAPSLPNYEASYTGLRGQYNVDSLEGSVNTLNAQKADIQAQYNATKVDEQGKPVAMNVITGRLTDEQQTAQDKIDAIDRQITTATGQLNTAYNVINSLMNFKQMDYTAAKGQYDSEFSQNMQMFNAVKGIDDTMKSQQQHDQDAARSNLQIMYNSIASNSEGTDSLSSAQKSTITKLEVQAGLPVGFYKTIQATNPGGKVISTTTRTDASGNKYADVITMDPKTGQPKTSSTYLGKDTGSSASDKTDVQNANENYIYNSLNGAAKGGDGFVDPSVWQSALKKWQDAGGSTATFFATFGGKVDNLGRRTSGFINPKNM